jgi:hypothetical protein
MAKAATKLDYKAPLSSPEGTPFTGPDAKPLTLREAITVVCSSNLPGDDALDMVAKYKVGEIAATVYKDLPLTSEQIVTLKERGAKTFLNPIMVYVLHETLEGKV